jgi:polar amino acid transport system substrate-binding protein
MLAAGCAVPEYHADTPSEYTTAANCLQSNRDNLQAAAGYAVRQLTVGTGDPALPPWWEGGATTEHPEWRRNDPYLGRGFEGALTFAIAARFGVPENRMVFVPVGFTRSFGAGPKPFDFAIEQIPYAPERAAHVDFSEGYLDVGQALVSTEGSPIATATSLDDLKDASLGARIGTAGLEAIVDRIRPSARPTVYGDLPAAVRGLKEGQVDGIVTDLSSAAFLTASTIPRGVIVGRLPSAGRRDHFAMAFEEGSPIVECVNLALRELEGDGTLDELRRTWLPNASGVPLIEG